MWNVNLFRWHMWDKADGTLYPTLMINKAWLEM